MKDTLSYCHPQTVRVDNVRRRKSVLDIGMLLFVIWTFICVLLPKTILGQVSPQGMLYFYEHNLPFSFEIYFNTSLVATTALALFWRIRRKSLTDSAKLLTVLMAVYLLALGAILTTYRDNPEAAQRLGSLIIFLSLGLLTACISPNLNSCAIALSLVSTVQATYSLIYYLSGVSSFVSGTQVRASGTFDHPNHLYTLMLVAFPLTFALAVSAKRTSLRFLLLLEATMQFVALVLTWYRGGIVALTVSMAVLVACVTRSRRMTVIVLLAMIPMLVGTWTIRGRGLQNNTSMEHSNGGHARTMLQGWQIVKQHLLTGVGVGNLRILIPHQDGSVGTAVLTEPKNLYLFYLAEWGIGGGLLFLALSAAVYGSIPAKPFQPTLIVGLQAAWVALLVAGLFDTPFGPAERTIGNYCFGLLIGLSAFVSNKAEPSNTEPQPNL